MQWGDVAFGPRHQPHAAKTEPFEQGSDIRLAAGQAVERVGKHHVHFTTRRRRQQSLNARAMQCGGRLSGVAERTDLGPSPPRKFTPAFLELDLDRQRILLVGREAGVE